MKIRMLETRLGSPDRVSVNSYEEGEEYDLPERLANNFVAQGAAKAVDGAPENKSRGRKKSDKQPDDGAAAESAEAE